jgi:RNA polymerase sigma factor (sigma-70 family)
MMLPPKLLVAIFEHPPHVVADEQRSAFEPAIKAAFGALGEQEKKIMILYYEHDLRQPSIAQSLGISLNQVRKMLSRSLQQLRMSGNPAYAYTVKNGFLSNRLN